MLASHKLASQVKPRVISQNSKPNLVEMGDSSQPLQLESTSLLSGNAMLIKSCLCLTTRQIISTKLPALESCTPQSFPSSHSSSFHLCSCNSPDSELFSENSLVVAVNVTVLRPHRLGSIAYTLRTFLFKYFSIFLPARLCS